MWHIKWSRNVRWNLQLAIYKSLEGRVFPVIINIVGPWGFGGTARLSQCLVIWPIRWQHGVRWEGPISGHHQGSCAVTGWVCWLLDSDFLICMIVNIHESVQFVCEFVFAVSLLDHFIVDSNFLGGEKESELKLQIFLTIFLFFPILSHALASRWNVKSCRKKRQKCNDTTSWWVELRGFFYGVIKKCILCVCAVSWF